VYVDERRQGDAVAWAHRNRNGKREEFKMVGALWMMSMMLMAMIVAVLAVVDITSEVGAIGVTDLSGPRARTLSETVS
jgi:hypothetical protein